MSRNVPASPWPFVGMGGLACALFLYGASGLVAPWWAVVVLLLVWVGFLVTACVWWTPHPKRLPVLAVVAIAFWFVALLGGSILFDWS
ncbi:hypothetical protein [Nocardioides sp. Root151]|uniref:hypothetical protein n=1 Tax=Nocardioides sp. Root151 TaxID=1736475 RepID=UPI000AE162A6|nr:hypothetical protein [Nocardioides sp. Root151]